MLTSRQKLAFDYFVSKGWAPVQAAAIVGGGMQESGAGLNTGAVGDAGRSHGVFQWNGPRLAQLYSFARQTGGDPNALQTQLAFADNELRTTEASAGNALRAARDPYSAARAFISYERPAGWTPQRPEAGHGFSNRYQNLLSVMGGAGGVPTNIGEAYSLERSPNLGAMFAPMASTPFDPRLAGFGEGAAPAVAPQEPDPRDARRRALLESIGNLFS